jgi:hypothetical protein
MDCAVEIRDDCRISIYQKGCAMTDQVRSNLVVEMSKGIDDLLLDCHPRPTLNEVIAAQVQSLGRAMSATSDPGLSLTTVKNSLGTFANETIRATRHTSN